MKVVNVVLSVLILLLAAASAVFSYFLFEKRGELVGSWNKMTAIVSKTATEMDKDSGTKVGQELSVDALNATAYADLDSKLAKLSAQAKDLAAVRTRLAESLRQVGKAVGNNSVDAKALSAVKGGEEQANKVVQAVGQYQQRHDKLAGDVVGAAGKLGAELNVNDVKNGANNALAPMLRQVDILKDRHTAYEGGFNRIGSTTGAGGIDNRDAKASISKIAGSVDKLKNDLSSTNGELASARETIASRDSQINSMKNQIAKFQSTLKDQQAVINTQKKALGIADDQEMPKEWATGSPEARRAVLGRVLAVNEKFGYISIDLGSDSRVKQQIGERTIEVNPEIKTGLIMMVSRGKLDRERSEYTAKVKVIKVDENCTIAEPEEASSRTIQTGDYVWFADNAN